MPAREKTLRGVCELLASQARRPLVPPAKLLGCAGGPAGFFLAVRALLIQAGAPPDLRPSTPLASFLKRWPGVFLNEISGLAPGGLPFTFASTRFGKLLPLSFIAGVLLLIASSVGDEPVMIIAGVILCAASWLGVFCYRGPLTLENVTTFRGLTELIVEQKRRAGVGPEKS